MIGEGEGAGREGGGQRLRQAGFVDGGPAGSEGREPICVGLDQLDGVSEFYEADGGDEPDVARADDRDLPPGCLHEDEA